MEKKGLISAFTAEIKDAIKVLQLKVYVLDSVYHRERAVKWGILFLILPPVLNMILTGLMFQGRFSAIFSSFLFWPLFIPVLSVVASVFIIALFAEKAYGKKGDKVGLFRVIAYASVAQFLTVLTFLLMLLKVLRSYDLYKWVTLGVSVWILVITYNVLKDKFKMVKNEALVTLGVGVLAYLIVGSVLGRLLVGNFYTWY
jgi:hypothetical protein